MGKVLQVRVWATTWDEKEVLATWPKLFRLAWPKGEPVYVAKQGVLECIHTLCEAHKFAGWPEELRTITDAPLRRLEALVRELENALADWDPRKANTVTDELEDTLSLLEKDIPKT